MQGGELLVPRIPSMKVTDLAQAIAPGAAMRDVGLRPGEKLHEEMISPEEGRRALRSRTAGTSSSSPTSRAGATQPPADGVAGADEFCYRSNTNDSWYTRSRSREILQRRAA